MTDAADFEAQLTALRQQYIKQLTNMLDGLVNRVPELRFGVNWKALAELHADLHKLSGSGGTFGFFELSRQARELEMTAQVWLEVGAPLELSKWQAWLSDLSVLGHALNADSDCARPLVGMQELPPLPSEPRGHVRIIMIDDDPAVGAELSKGLSQFGYEVWYCMDFVSAEAEIRDNVPDVLIVDIMLSGQVPDDGTEALPLLFDRLGYRLPTIFLTGRKDFSARLAAAQAGGRAFLTKPVDIATLAGRVEMLVREREHAPYRVLIVDDDEALAEHYRLTLNAAGILAEKVCRPQDTLEAMQNQHPDLLIIDLYMPDCKGSDLALAIRYEDEWMSVPIVYLSAEDDLDEQINALGNGGDDFLTKPISDVRLVSTVRARAARARKVDELMSQDSLTGLLKHSSIKDSLTHELDRAHRQGTVMALAMVDMDHFKQVNDTFGHPMGDQVIKTLAHLLRQRLRRQDHIGRYGGEEFAVVLPECSAEDAIHLLNDIRQRFSEIQFAHKGQNFVVTLSGGVVDSRQCSDGQGLLAMADAALYVAKDSGRNQVQGLGDGVDLPVKR